MSWQSIRDTLARYNPFKYKGILNYKADGQLAPAIENMCCEVYNPHPLEEVVFHSFHPEMDKMFFFGKPPQDWKTVVCGPQEWAFLPHGLYLARTRKGGEITWACTVNVGDAMFKGNKLPSRPEAKKVQVFTHK